MTLPSGLIESLDRLARTAAEIGLDDDWIVFGGAAMAMAGYDGPVPDVDVLASATAARRLTAALGGKQMFPVDDTAPFRSSFLARCAATPVPIEIMTDLCVRAAGVWSPVRFGTRVMRRAGAEDLPVPQTSEQIAMARRFGRPKDLARADALERLLPDGVT